MLGTGAARHGLCGGLAWPVGVGWGGGGRRRRGGRGADSHRPSPVSPTTLPRRPTPRILRPNPGLPTPQQCQVNPAIKCPHVALVVGEDGPHGPDIPSFYVLASDRPDEPLCGKSMSSAWEAAIQRIRRACPGAYAPDTVVSGPMHFGMADPGKGARLFAFTWGRGSGMGGVEGVRWGGGGDDGHGREDGQGR